MADHFYLMTLMIVASLAHYSAVKALNVEVAVAPYVPQQGSRVVFTCSFSTTADMLYQISWYFGDSLSIRKRIAHWQYEDPDLIFYYNSNGYGTPKYTMDTDQEISKAKLIIDPVGLDNTGRYWCEVFDFNDVKGQGYANIVVGVVPTTSAPLPPEPTVEDVVKTPPPTQAQGVRAVLFLPRVTTHQPTTKTPRSTTSTLPFVPSAAGRNADKDDAFQFGISQSSRLEYNRSPGTFRKRGSVALQVRTSTSNGILFHIADKDQTDKEFGFIKDGYVYYGFDYGVGHVTLQSNVTINDGEWHHVEFYRYQMTGIIRIDGFKVAKATITGLTTSLTTLSTFYLGGLPIGYSGKGIDAVSKISLQGCIKELKFNGVRANDPDNLFHVEPCGNIKELDVSAGSSGGYVAKTSISSHNVESGNLLKTDTIASTGTMPMDVIICLAVILMLLVVGVLFICYFNRNKRSNSSRKRVLKKNNGTAMEEPAYQDLHKGLRENPHIYECPTLDKNDYEIPFDYHEYSEVTDICKISHVENEEYKELNRCSMDKHDAYQELRVGN